MTPRYKLSAKTHETFSWSKCHIQVPMTQVTKSNKDLEQVSLCHFAQTAVFPGTFYLYRLLIGNQPYLVYTLFIEIRSYKQIDLHNFLCGSVRRTLIRHLVEIYIWVGCRWWCLTQLSKTF